MPFLLFGLIKAVTGYESKNEDENVQDRLRYLLGRTTFDKKYIAELDSIFPFIGEFDAQDFAYELSRTSFELFSYFIEKLIERGDIKFIEEIFFIIDKGGYPQNKKQKKLDFLEFVYRRTIKEELTKIEDNQHRIIPELAEEIMELAEE